MRKLHGNTLIELLIAMMVISVGLFTAATLVYGNLALVQRDTDQVTAMNLAREGLELAKQLRDSNWLAGKSFDDGMVGTDPMDYTATPKWTGGAVNPSFQFVANDFTHPDTAVVAVSDVSALDFFANQTSDVPFAATSTPYQRLITFHPLCDDGSVKDSGSNCQQNNPNALKIGVRVESHIRWARKGTQYDTVVFTDLYDWR